MKCKDCERDEPIEKLKRVIRSRIISALNNKNKHTVEYLGCNIPDYLNWLLKNILLGPRNAHWNNAEIGSHIKFTRKPNVFERNIYDSMCFFHS